MSSQYHTILEFADWQCAKKRDNNIAIIKLDTGSITNAECLSLI